jgi:hypothetical protein
VGDARDGIVATARECGVVGANAVWLSATVVEDTVVETLVRIRVTKSI